MCKNYKLSFVSELIICNNPKANEKIFWVFVDSDANFQKICNLCSDIFINYLFINLDLSF